MRRFATAAAAAITTLQAGAALAHPGHGVTPSGTPGHAFEHLGQLVASSPVAWLAVAGLGLAALNLALRRWHGQAPVRAQVRRQRRP